MKRKLLTQLNNMAKVINQCPICNTKSIISKTLNNDAFGIECKICGSFMIDNSVLESREAVESINKNERKLSGIIRLLNLRHEKIPYLKLENLDEHIKNPLIPDVQDVELKLDFLLSAMKAIAKIPGRTCNIDLEKDYPLAFAWDVHELVKLLEGLEEDGLIELEDENDYLYGTAKLEPKTFKNRKQNRSTLSLFMSDNSYAFHVTRKGWGSNAKTKTDSMGFIAIDFNKSMDDAIKAIESGITDTGYIPMSIKDKDYPETVMEKALGEIRKSMFVIVDITNLRPSVFYEAGFAHAIGKPVYFVCSNTFREEIKEKGKELEFYCKQYKIRFYNDLPELKKMISILIEANFPIRKKS